MKPSDPTDKAAGTTALERARNLSQALSEAARMARLSSRSRHFAGGGFHARRGERLMRLAIAVSFMAVVVLPTVAAALYYGFIAADQYVAEAKFTVASGEVPKLDSVGLLTGIPAASVIQDTQVVTNYIQSRAAVEKLEATLGLRRMYSRSEADFWARFRPDKPIEKLVEYWEKMIKVSIKMPSGIVEIEVRAFSPDDAYRIANSVLDISEALINDINSRMYSDAVKNAEEQLQRASVRLAQARIALEKARDEGGVLDVSKAADAVNALIADMKSTLLQLQQEYATQRRSVDDSAPQMRALKARIESTNAQIDALQSKLTTSQKGPVGEATLAVAMTKFSELDLERQIAERIYSAAASSLEIAKLTSERKTMYINAFVRPLVPHDALYPRRALFTFLIFAGGLVVWGIGCGLATVVRNHMA